MDGHNIHEGEPGLFKLITELMLMISPLLFLFLFVSVFVLDVVPFVILFGLVGFLRLPMVRSVTYACHLKLRFVFS